jgi:hypothetical protein
MASSIDAGRTGSKLPDQAARLLLLCHGLGEVAKEVQESLAGFPDLVFQAGTFA